MDPAALDLLVRMVDNRDPDSRRGPDQHEHLSSQHMVPVCGQPRLGRAGHNVAQMEPAHSADSDHHHLSATSGSEHLARDLMHA